MTTKASELVFDVEALPSQDTVIKTIVQFHLRELLRVARRAEEVGLLTTKGALLDHPRAGRVFMGSAAVDLIEAMMRWPSQEPSDAPTLTRRQKLEIKIREVLRSCPESDVLSKHGLTIVITHDVCPRVKFTAWLREQS